jgi:hypothetical protein
MQSFSFCPNLNHQAFVTMFACPSHHNGLMHSSTPGLQRTDEGGVLTSTCLHCHQRMISSLDLPFSRSWNAFTSATGPCCRSTGMNVRNNSDQADRWKGSLLRSHLIHSSRRLTIGLSHRRRVWRRSSVTLARNAYQADHHSHA